VNAPRAWRALVRSGAPVVALAVALAALAGCSGGMTAGSPGAAAAGLDAVPRVGTCWDVPRRTAMRTPYAHGDAAVPCSGPHTTETVFASRLDRPTPRTALEQFGRLCYAQAREYVGQDALHWTPVQGELYVPGGAEVAAGAAWVRCDVVMPQGPRTAVARVLHASVADAAHRDRATVWACVPYLRGVTSTSYVPCSEPHAYESSGRLLLVDTTGGRPSTARLQHAGRVCAPVVRGRPALAVDAVWDSRPMFHRLAGFCWIHRKDGRPLPPIR
jgi:hypothetical protein